MLSRFNKYVLHSNLCIIFLIMLNFLRLYITIFQQTFILNRSDVTPFTKKNPPKTQKNKKTKIKIYCICKATSTTLCRLTIFLATSFAKLLDGISTITLDLSYLVNSKHFPNNFFVNILQKLLSIYFIKWQHHFQLLQ